MVKFHQNDSLAKILKRLNANENMRQAHNKHFHYIAQDVQNRRFFLVIDTVSKQIQLSTFHADKL